MKNYHECGWLVHILPPWIDTRQEYNEKVFSYPYIIHPSILHGTLMGAASSLWPVQATTIAR
jgi:hypothetical protein